MRNRKFEDKAAQVRGRVRGIHYKNNKAVLTIQVGPGYTEDLRDRFEISVSKRFADYLFSGGRIKIIITRDKKEATKGEA